MDDRWWRQPPEALSASLASGPAGLGERQAAEALARWGPNTPGGAKRRPAILALVLRFRNPLLLLLVVAAAISAATGDAPSALVILVVLAASVALDFYQERRAADAVARLRALVRVTARVRRDGIERDIPAVAIVPGDVVLLAAGDLVPADGVLVSARDLYVNQAALTGEAYPVEKWIGKRAGAAASPDGPEEAGQALLAGSHVVSGSATMLCCLTGSRTHLGGIAELVAARTRPNPLEQGTRRFGMMLLRLTLLLVLFVVLVNAWLARPMLESFLFAVALRSGSRPSSCP